MSGSSRTRRRLGGSEGTLLVEALTTFALSALVLAGLVATSGLFLRILDRSVAHAHEVESLDRAMTAIGRDLRHLVRARWEGPAPRSFIFEGHPTRLVFALADGGMGGERQVGERIVSLSSRVSPQGGRILRSEAPLRPGATGPKGVAFGAAQELHAGRTRLRFAFVAPSKQGQPVPPPLPDWPAGSLLPEAVLVEMVDPETGRVVLSARTRLMVDADIGCLQGGQGPCGLPGRQDQQDPNESATVAARSSFGEGRL
ncbi:hypothetical protein [Methylobacterium sp. Leaf93]|uniref:PulJ/GspJ family protein n=1 Tax=Methylobacterium sp. Leaf93 TaxID=1736249 RepID=UPI0007019D30|nr:hypothetical protein [Methylobacterium sp. Leaf93]KQP15364.1 hypothetical protein ASF26_16640 [Methylobacterium sp. Leaf93]